MTSVKVMAVRAGLAAAFAALTVAPAAAAVGDWASGIKAKVRLVAAGIGDDGRLAAGIEIVLPPSWKTYWRSPGDAGIAPVFDFADSKNLGTANVSFPPPHRFDDGYSVTNVYQDSVVLPVSAEVRDPNKDVDLSVDIKLGVCQEVCVPDEVKAHVIVPAGDNDGAAARMLADARAALPGPPEPGAFFVDGVERDGGTDARPVFRFSLTVPDPAHTTIFVEGPPDWYAGTPVPAGEGTGAYTVKFDRLVAKTPIAGAHLRFTVVSGSRAIEQTIGLDEDSQVR
jgi:DsbC/DsbD-like thiol-disulfide interchange protein